MPPARNVQALVRRTHEERVLAVLRERGGLSRAQIAERVGLSRTTLSEIAGDLVARGALVVVDTDARSRTGSGRRAELLALDPTSGQYVGVDIGHSRVRVLIADVAHEVIGAGSAPYAEDEGWTERVAAAVALVDRLAAEKGLHFGALQGVAVGVTGTDATRRREAHEAFATHLGVPVVTDNNTRFAALAEAMSETGPDGVPGELVYLRVAEGIGGGLVVGGRLIAGGRGAAGELGHVRVATGPGARRCRCGRTGCLETVAALPALLARTGLTTPRELRAAADASDPAVSGALDEAADAIGQVLATTALVLSPERIVVGGLVAADHPRLVERVAARVATELASVGSGPPAVVPAVLGDDDGATGAIAALLQRSPLLAGYLEPLDADLAEQRGRARA